jgi:hypothetical protein
MTHPLILGYLRLRVTSPIVLLSFYQLIQILPGLGFENLTSKRTQSDALGLEKLQVELIWITLATNTFWNNE